MHDMHEPNCSYCKAFVLPFDKKGPLSEYGYCRLETVDNEPTAEELKKLDSQAAGGDYGFLTDKKIPIYEAYTEGCEEFKHFADNHH